ncbi:hypothetical protein [Amycolatopsis sp. NBRC 101858]|uniref:hypothetical protein n=1 Tax=Amycolatopsis sp. NBRC 101858 TaxID=3032200 RepID=UPI00255210E4|nr:hypothetical protein [Amycolatopsis sp. NBRC 101858]
MTGPPAPDRPAMAHRLITMRRSITQLESLGPIDGNRFARDSTAGLVIERVLALLADLAFAVNCAVVPSAPRTPAESFEAACRIGLIDAEVAAALAPVEGPHHVLMQLSLDVEPDEAAAVVSRALAGYREYVRQVAGWLTGADSTV